MIDWKAIVQADEGVRQAAAEQERMARVNAMALERQVNVLFVAALRCIPKRIADAGHLNETRITVLAWSNANSFDEAAGAAAADLLESGLQELGVKTSRGGGEGRTFGSACYELYADVADLVRVARSRAEQ